MYAIQTRLQNMLWTKLENLQIEHEKTKMYTFQNFQFHFHYWVMAKNVLIKTQKPELCHCQDGLMVKLSVSQAVQNCTHGLESHLGQIFFPNFFFLLQVHTS